MRAQKEERTRKRVYPWFTQSPFAPRTGVGSLLALSRRATPSIRVLFVPVWRRLAVFLRFQLLYISIGLAPFPGPSLHRECYHTASDVLHVGWLHHLVLYIHEFNLKPQASPPYSYSYIACHWTATECIQWYTHTHIYDIYVRIYYLFTITWY